ncbi:ABC-type sugar transport system substrate-binding protein [Arthrobacter globiformis]|nr:ABC-type sugar transport system substrate-binding protein [Arthrobacter globiformis]
MTAKLQATTAADAIIGLGAPYTLTILKAVTTAGSKAMVASFDMNLELAQKIADGEILFPWAKAWKRADRDPADRRARGAMTLECV